MYVVVLHPCLITNSISNLSASLFVNSNLIIISNVSVLFLYCELLSLFGKGATVEVPSRTLCLFFVENLRVQFPI